MVGGVGVELAPGEKPPLFCPLPAVAVPMVGAEGVAPPPPPMALSAASTCIRLFAMALRESVTDTPVEVSAVNASLTVRVVFFCFSTAQAPATWGAAIDVPCQLA